MSVISPKTIRSGNKSAGVNLNLTKDSKKPVETKAALVEFFESGCKPSQMFRLGTEHELFVYQLMDHSPAPYEGDGACLRNLLEALVRNRDWDPIHEGTLLVALKKGLVSITLEPGGQLEVSGEALSSVHEVWHENRSHRAGIMESGRESGLCFAGLGFQPMSAPDRLPLIPKARYRIMRDHLPTKGALGLEMMQATAGMHVNLDFNSESDMVKKLRVSLALQPLATTMFANSPFVAGRVSEFLSYRSHVWTDTDPDRCGMLSFAFDDSMSFERYTDYLLDVPMLFVHRDGTFIDARGQSFRDFLA